jgi:hypothetical protein
VAIGIGTDIRRKDLDGDGAIEPGVDRSIDLAHAAGADERRDFIGSESRAW